MQNVTVNDDSINWVVKCLNDVIRTGHAMYTHGLSKDETFISEFVQWQTTSVILLERVTPPGSVLEYLFRKLADETWKTISCDGLQEYLGHMRAMKNCYINGFLNYCIAKPE